MELNRPRLLAATAIIFAAHLLFFALAVPVPIGSDALQYELTAHHLASGQGFTLDGQRVTSVMPGYSLFVAGIYVIFGRHPWVVRVVQALLVAVCAALLYRLAHRRFGARAGWVAFLCVALLPGFFIYPGTLNAEILLFTIQVLFLGVVLTEPLSAPVRGAASGALCGLMALVKPEFFVWLPASVVADRRQRGRALVASLLGFLLVLSPWIGRNYLAFHRVIPFSTRSGQALWLSGHKPELLEFKAPAYREAHDRCFIPGDPKGTDDCLMAEARTMVASHPGYFLQTSLRRVGRSLFGSHTEQLQGYSRSFLDVWRHRDLKIFAVKAALLAVQTVFVLFGLAGVVWLAAVRRDWVLAYLVASNLGVHALLFGSPRYGLHLTPALALACGALADHLMRRGQRDEAA